MAEVQTSTETGEMAQRFIEFVMMQAQQAAFYLGQIPNPQTGKGEVHLDVAKMLIDQLVMIRSKTRGNLSQDEQGVLNNAISNLQMAFFEVSQHLGVPQPAPESEEEPAPPAAGQAAAQPEASKPAETKPAEPEPESRKKFTKSYGG
jgi:uncharacterized protein DUF1844